MAFLDTTDLDSGQHWPSTLMDALLAARLVVIFAEDSYFQRRYCWRELRAALAPFLVAQGRTDTTEAEKREALAALIVARSVAGSTGMEYLPPLLRETQWPRADETEALERLIRSTLETAKLSLGERLTALGASHQKTASHLLEELALEPPSALSGNQRLHPVQFPPSLSTTFVGRANELWWIDVMLRAQDPLSNPRIVALQGGGGTGKTRIALEYLHRYGRHYPGGIFWIDADTSEERLEEQLYGVLCVLRPETPELPLFRKQRRNASDELAQALREVPADQPILYIVDNLPEPSGEQRLRPLKTWCPGLGRVSLLVTSRMRLTEQSVRVLAIEPLSPDCAVVMLTQDVTDYALSPSDWQRIVHWVGHLPLALELLRSALRLAAISPGELLEKAQHARPAVELDHQMDALREQVPPESLRGVTEAFSLSYERLLQEARKAARLIALLAPEPIPIALLNALGPEVSTSKLRAALVARSFVTQLSGRDIPLFGRMHRLLADFLRIQSPEPGAELLHVGRAVRDMIPPAACRDSEAWPMLHLWLPHAEAVHGCLSQQRVPLDASLEANLGMLMGYYLAERGALTQARQLGIDVLNRAQATLGAEHADTLAAMNNLALTLRELGDNARAIAVGRQLLEVSRRVLGNEHQHTLVTMGNLASALQDEELFSEALALKKEVLESRQRTLGADHPETLAAMNNLALLLEQLGEIEQAFELQKQAFLRALEILGPKHPDTLLAMNNLARFYGTLGDWEEAQRLQERVLAEFLESHGPHHPKTLTLRSQLALTLFRKGSQTEAQRITEELLAIHARELGDAHPSTLLVLQNLVEMHRQRGEYSRARALQESVVERFRQTLGEGHRETLNALSALVETLSMAGSAKDALAQAEALLRLFQQHMGEDHPSTLSTMSRLAGLYGTQGMLQRARELGQHALEAWTRLLGTEALETTLAAWGQLQVLRALGDVSACQALQASHLQWMLEREPTALHPLQQQLRRGLLQEAQATGPSPVPREPQAGVSLQDLEAIGSDHERLAEKADILLQIAGTPVESNQAYEQIRSFLLGKLLSRGIRRGEAAAVVERRHKEYRVQLLLVQGNEEESMGTMSMPLKGHTEKAFAALVKKAGISELDDPSVFVVTLRATAPKTSFEPKPSES